MTLKEVVRVRKIPASLLGDFLLSDCWGRCRPSHLGQNGLRVLVCPVDSRSRGRSLSCLHLSELPLESQEFCLQVSLALLCSVSLPSDSWRGRLGIHSRRYAFMSCIILRLRSDYHGGLLAEEVCCIIASDLLLLQHLSQVTALTHDCLTMLASEDLLANRLRGFSS